MGSSWLTPSAPCPCVAAGGGLGNRASPRAASAWGLSPSGPWGMGPRIALTQPPATPRGAVPPDGACCPQGYPSPPRVPVAPEELVAPKGACHPRGYWTPPRVPVTPKGAHCFRRVPATPKGACRPQGCLLPPKVPVAPEVPVAPGSARSPSEGLELGDASVALLPPRAAAAWWPEPYNFSFFLLKTNNLFLIK